MSDIFLTNENGQIVTSKQRWYNGYCHIDITNQSI